MKTYVCHKTVRAKPMTRGEYNLLRLWTLPANEDHKDEGYLVEYLDSGEPNHKDFQHYISWSPKAVFEKGYVEVGSTLPPFQQRLVMEHADLVTRYDKLTAFIGTEPFNGLDPVSRELLVQQHTLMDRLAGVLDLRISRLINQGTT